MINLVRNGDRGDHRRRPDPGFKGIERGIRLEYQAGDEFYPACDSQKRSLYRTCRLETLASSLIDSLDLLLALGSRFVRFCFPTENSRARSSKVKLCSLVHCQTFGTPCDSAASHPAFLEP